MKIFLTGGTGFIGKHLLRELAQTEHSVIALRRGSCRTAIEIDRQPLWLQKEMDKLAVFDFDGVDVLVHLASVGVSPKVASWQELVYWNIAVMLDLIEKAYLGGVKRIVLAGSFAEYGLSADRYDFIPTDAPLLPTSPYASSKAAGFIAAHAFALEKQLELCYLRIFSAYGEGQHINNFWPSLRAAAYGGRDFEMTPGGQIRDFIPVETVAKKILQSIEDKSIATNTKPFIANVGSGSPMTVLEFAEKCWSEWGATGQILAGAKQYRSNEPMRYVPLLISE